MQFLAVREPKSMQYRDHWQTSQRGMFFHFDYELTPDPMAESVRVVFAPDFRMWCPPELWPDIEAGVSEGCWLAAARGRPLCCTRMTLVSAKYHDVDTSPRGVRLRVESCVSQHITDFAKPLAPLRPEWLTSDVVPLAQGLIAGATVDCYLVHDHLQLCPDHGPSCWVAEMIRHQTRAAGA